MTFKADNSRTREGQKARRTGLVSAAGQDKTPQQRDKRRTQGWSARPKDNSRQSPDCAAQRTTAGQEEDTGLVIREEKLFFF